MPARPIPAKGANVISDGLANVVSGIGTGADKNAYNNYSGGLTPMSQVEVEAAYRGSWLVRKVHDLPAFDAVREWRDWQAEDDVIAKIEAEEKRLGLRQKTLKALKAARLYGGGALIMGGKGLGLPKEPLDPAKVGPGALEYVHVVSRHRLAFTELDQDISSPFFGQPKSYQLSGTTAFVDLHPSRVIPFLAQEAPEGSTGADTFWGDPLLMSLRDAMMNADMVQAGIATLVHEAKVDTLSIPRLAELLMTEAGEAQVKNRIRVANLAKSSINTRILDAEEKWETRELSFAALPDVLKLFLQIAAGAADIPATRLLGTSPDGMNATGKSDLDNYFMMIGAKQENEFRPCLERLDAVMLPSLFGAVPKDVYFEFAPLQKSDPVQLATIEKTRAETVKIYTDTGVIPDTALAKAAANAMVESGQFPGLEKALKDAEAAGDIPDLLEEPEEDPSALTAGPDGKPMANPVKPGQEAALVPAAKVTTGDAEPRSLYVSRKVVNAADLIAWAKAQGFKTTTPADELHVTVAYSRTPIDWMSVEEQFGADKDGRLTVAAGGPRVVEPLGDKGAVVLMFNSWELAYRHGVIRRAGASWDFPGYQPHITITYEAGDLDLAKVEPYRGPIVLGPEIFAEVVENWETGVTEV